MSVDMMIGHFIKKQNVPSDNSTVILDADEFGTHSTPSHSQIQVGGETLPFLVH